MIQNASEASKSGMLTGSSPAAAEISRMDKERRLRIFQSEDEATLFFRKELAIPTLDDDLFPEKRQFIRLRTVLPLHISTHDEEGMPHEFFAVVTNLSEGGLFAEFIESLSEEGVKRTIDPYDLKLIDLKIGLGGQRPFQARGKLIHGDLVEGGMGIEFYDMQERERILLQDWISQHLVKPDDTQH